MAGLHAIINGHVQGVFFRAFIQEKARGLNLKGYVRNLPTGEVEVLAEGSKQELKKLVEYLKIGPPAARVAGLEIQWLKHSAKYHHFIIED